VFLHRVINPKSKPNHATKLYQNKTMMFNKSIALTLLLSTSTTAFNVGPSKKVTRTPSALEKNVAKVLTAGVISAATLLPILPSPAVAASNVIIGTPLETKLANFGAASYPVFNSISDVSPLADKFLELVDKKVKPDDAANVAVKAVDGLLAIPDSSVLEYSGVLKQAVFSGVKPASCVTLGGSGKALETLGGAATKAVGADKYAALEKKFKPANSVVPMSGADICLPGSAAASEKLWVAQAELTSSMPNAEASALASSIRKAGLQANRPALATIVANAETTFSKSPEALNMVKAGKDVEPSIIATAAAALK